jgi:hypothetical protein
MHGIDEGELEIELSATTPALYSTASLENAVFSSGQKMHDAGFSPIR